MPVADKLMFLAAEPVSSALGSEPFAAVKATRKDAVRVPVAPGEKRTVTCTVQVAAAADAVAGSVLSVQPGPLTLGDSSVNSLALAPVVLSA